MELTRREFLKRSGQAAIALGIAGLPMTEVEALGRKSLEETLKPENYAKLTKNWDPIYGPDIPYSRGYGGKADFVGHSKLGFAGVDYDVPTGTPLASVTGAALHIITVGRPRATSGLTIYMKSTNAKYLFRYSHLDEVLIDERFIYNTEKPSRILNRNEVIALSGNSGQAEGGENISSHLHLSLYRGSAQESESLDPEKFGLDGGRPTFFDGKTPIAPSIRNRLPGLETQLHSLPQELASWPEELSELKGRILEHYKLMGDAKGQQIVDSKHFQDIRALLKLCTLETKKFVPGSKPYSLMLGILGYSMVPPYSNQEVILTLPFIAPGVVQKYKRAVYENGPFYQLKDNKIIPVTK